MKKLGAISAIVAFVVGTLAMALAGTIYAQEASGVTASGTANAKIAISLTNATMALGTPDPTCEALSDGSTTGEFTVYNGATGNEGCSYVWDALTVTVKSNKPWTGTIAGSDGSPTSGVTVALGGFHYDTAAAASTYTACSSDTVLATTTPSFESSGVIGQSIYSFHHCVVLDWDDADGTIDSTITYTVTQ